MTSYHINLNRYPSFALLSFLSSSFCFISSVRLSSCIKVEIGIAFEEYIDEAKEEYATVEEAVTDLENELNITYIEEE